VSRNATLRQCTELLDERLVPVFDAVATCTLTDSDDLPVFPLAHRDCGKKEHTEVLSQQGATSQSD
jgi:hypothetical protein